MNFIQYLNENNQIKTVGVLVDAAETNFALSSFIVSGINENFFILSLFLDNVKQSSVDFPNSPNMEQISVINDTFTDLGTINLNSFFPSETVVKLSLRKELIVKGFQKPVIYPFKKPFFKDQNIPLDQYLEDEFLMRCIISLDYNKTTNKMKNSREYQNGKENNANMYYILTPRVGSSRFNDIYVKIDSSFTDVPFQGPYKQVDVIVWLDIRTNEVYLSIMPTGTYTPIVLETFGVEHTANGFKVVHAETGTNIEVSDIWL